MVVRISADKIQPNAQALVERAVQTAVKNAAQAEVATWLDEISLGQYAEGILAKGYDYKADLLLLTDEQVS